MTTKTPIPATVQTTYVHVPPHAPELAPAVVSYVAQAESSLKHPKNIEYGAAKVIYAQAVGRRPMGWVLPGGLRTTDYEEAFAWAVRMDALIGGTS